MSKGIIVVDMPEKCIDCEFCREISEGIEACCEMTIDPDDNDFLRMIDDYCQLKPGWCPIKPMPEKKMCSMSICIATEEYHQRKGWNACIDKIEGDSK